MYSTIKSIQLLTALLKKYNINKLVLSPGGSDIPIIHSLENDSFFNCHSVVDERSAVYYGIGVAQQTHSPVACICTSGTAVSNYLPGMTEAFYQDVPIVAITADKDPYRLNQLMLQKTQQVNIFESVTKKSVNLPVVRGGNDRWYCERLINEALSELDHHGTGPVHINIPIVENSAVYDCENLPQVRKINRISPDMPSEKWREYAERLSKYKKILVIAGQNNCFSEDDRACVEKFFEKYNCLISVEHMSNLKCNGCLMTYPLSECSMQGMFGELCPDLIISFGNNIASYKLKPMIKAHKEKFVHWQIDTAGRIRDFSDKLTDVFECTPQYFFNCFAENAPQDSKNDMTYYNMWNDDIKMLDYSSNLPFSNMYVAKKLAEIIPDRSVLHLAILSSTRTMQFFDLKPNVKVYSNIGALGIDGCMSSFFGQASATDELAFCVVGDLSFFYDMNSAGIRGIKNNARIILLNNGGGSEFHFFMGKEKIPTINQYICAEHHKGAKGWIESLGYDYYSATTKEEVDNIIPTLAEESDRPIFVEIFTDMEEDAKLINRLFHDNRMKFGGMKLKMMEKAKSILSPSQIQKAKKLLKK
jgi:2-succinyl-5-enolpyruvyl-6-hydroxy-3-cyclohexene-1-carboxylate synthase